MAELVLTLLPGESKGTSGQRQGFRWLYASLVHRENTHFPPLKQLTVFELS